MIPLYPIAVVIVHDVVRLQIAVEHVVLVQVAHALGDLQHHVEDHGAGEADEALFAVNELVEVGAVHPLEEDREAAAEGLVDEADHLDYVLVFEKGQDGYFGVEAALLGF